MTSNKLQTLKDEASKWGKQSGRFEVDYNHLQQLIRCAELASEFCNAIEAEHMDVGGHRPSSMILRELGPACDRVEGR